MSNRTVHLKANMHPAFKLKNMMIPHGATRTERVKQKNAYIDNLHNF